MSNPLDIPRESEYNNLFYSTDNLSRLLEVEWSGVLCRLTLFHKEIHANLMTTWQKKNPPATQ